MKVALIGMSGTGKTYWSKKLQEAGFKRFGCDDLIEQLLGEEFKTLGYSGIQDVAKWMGQPFDKHYSERSKKYLAFEKQVIENLCDFLEKNKDAKENIVIDTTGSVIHVGDHLGKKLSHLATILYLHTPESVQQEMYDLYLQDPKPVIWGNIFKKRFGEKDMEALKRLYPKLLDFRAKKYLDMSHIILNRMIVRAPSFTTKTLLTTLSSVAEE